MKILRLSTPSLILAVAVFALGYVNPASAVKPGANCVPPGKIHPSCPKEEPLPDPLVPCGEFPCIVSVGKSPSPAVTDYVLATESGSYSVMSSGRFGEILGTLEAIGQLCAAFDVVIVEWSNSPNMKNLTWANLLAYMNCGGGIIFEDPRNVVALAPQVNTEEINFHSREDEPIDITVISVSGLTTGLPLNCTSGMCPLQVVNQHMTFNEGAGSPGAPFVFLRLAGSSTDAVGIYGMHGNGGIVLTGPDNGFHGDCNSNPNLSAEINAARKNNARLLWNELNWLLSIGPASVTTDGCN